MNKNNLEVIKHASRDRHPLDYIYYDGNQTIATDSYRLIKITTRDAPINDHDVKPVLLNAKQLKAVKPSSATDNIIVGHTDKQAKLDYIKKGDVHSVIVDKADVSEYPNIEQVEKKIIPKTKNATVTFKINAHYLAEMAKSLGNIAKDGDTLSIDMEIHGDDKPLVMRASTGSQDAIGIIMPIQK